jgi:thioredoxin 1
MEHLTKESFIEKIFDYENNETWEFKGTKPAIIDFYADWCGPCKMVGPVMEELSQDFKGQIDVYKIDTEQEVELSALFNIRSIPSVLFIPVGSNPRMSVGALPKEGYMQAIGDIFEM